MSSQEYKKAKMKEWTEPLTKKEIKEITHHLMEKLLDDDEKGTSGHFLLRILASHGKLLDEVEKHKWQPIETAPKDRTDILIWDRCYCCHRIAHYSEINDDDFRWTDGQYFFRDVTQWMPLLRPPEENKN